MGTIWSRVLSRATLTAKGVRSMSISATPGRSTGGSSMKSIQPASLPLLREPSFS